MHEATPILTKFAHISTSVIPKITLPDVSFAPILGLNDATARAISSDEVFSG
ncbi:MAG: hypothetical protein OSA51_10615 [Octadecabacter sp.]|nr:hypothetical protein [Octadecabacter sp.]